MALSHLLDITNVLYIITYFPIGCVLLKFIHTQNGYASFFVHTRNDINISIIGGHGCPQKNKQMTSIKPMHVIK
jgi:hypothetical protein